MHHVASVCDRRACQKGNIEVMSLNGDDVTRWAALDKIGADAWIRSDIGPQQIREEARSERRKNPDANGPRFTAPARTRVDGRVANLAQCPARTHEESFPGVSETYAGVVTDKERGADLIFQISNAAAYRGFLDLQRLGRTPEAAAFGSRNNIAEMAQLHQLHPPRSSARSSPIEHWIKIASYGAERFIDAGPDHRR